MGEQNRTGRIPRAGLWITLLWSAVQIAVASAQESAQEQQGADPAAPAPAASPGHEAGQGPGAAQPAAATASAQTGAVIPAPTADAARPDGAAGQVPRPVDGASSPPKVAVDRDSEALRFEFIPLAPSTAGGLTTDGVGERVQEVGPDVRKARAEERFAERNAGRAWVVFAPRLDLTASYTRLSPVDFPDFGFPAGDGAAPANPFRPILDNYALRAAVRVPISDYFLTLHHDYGQTQELSEFSKLQQQGAGQAAAYQAKQEYFDLAQKVAARTLTDYRVRQLGLFVDEVRALVEGGEVGSVQLAQARVNLANAKAAARQALADQRTAEQVLRSRLALGTETPIGVGEPLLEELPAPPVNLAGLLGAAHEQRPEMAALTHLLESQRHARSSAGWKRLPKLAAVGDLNYANPNQRLLPPEEKFYATWSVGLELSWSPNDWAAFETQYDLEDKEVTKVIEDMRDLYGRIDAEVTGAYEQARAAHAAVESAREAVEAAEEAHSATLELFRAGESTSRAVLEQELDLRAAQLTWVNAVLATHLANAALEHAIGHAE